MNKVQSFLCQVAGRYGLMDNLWRATPGGCAQNGGLLAAVKGQVDIADWRMPGSNKKVIDELD